jgi:hypothetical protein
MKDTSESFTAFTLLFQESHAQAHPYQTRSSIFLHPKSRSRGSPPVLCSEKEIVRPGSWEWGLEISGDQDQPCVKTWSLRQLSMHPWELLAGRLVMEQSQWMKTNVGSPNE